MAKDWTSESYIFPEDCQRWENKAPSTSATISSDGLMSKEDKIKLNGISVGADKTPGLATNTTSGLMSGADKAKLGGIEEGSQKNRLIASKLVAEGGTDNSYVMTPLRTKESILKFAPPETLATITKDGLMSKEDKSKLGGIEINAGRNRLISSKSQAEAGTNNETDMTPLRVKEAITYQRPYASQGTAESGISSTSVMTPKGTKQSIYKHSIVVIEQGSGLTSRPEEATVVYWTGPMEPKNALDNDIWVGGLI